MKKHKNISNDIENKKSNYKILIILIIVFAILGIALYFIITYNNLESKPIVNNLILSDSYTLENSNNLISKDFSIEESDGIYKIKGTIENVSNENLSMLDFIYTLYDDSNNVVYEFNISILSLEAYTTSSFSSVCITNLSNVTNYSTKLSK